MTGFFSREKDRGCEAKWIDGGVMGTLSTNDNVHGHMDKGMDFTNDNVPGHMIMEMEFSGFKDHWEGDGRL